MSPEPLTRQSSTVSGLPIAVGVPSIGEAPEVRICESPSGKKSVWVQGIGYLTTDERHELGRWLAGEPQWKKGS